jgi:hypothetical protein
MGNHFHILVRMFPDHKFTDEEIKKRFAESKPNKPEGV